MSPALVWTLLSTVGAIVAAWGAVDAWHDLRAAADSGSRRYAWGYLRGELTHLGIFGAWAVIGYLRVIDPAPSLWTPGVIVLIVTLALLVLRSVLDAVDRLAVRRAAVNANHGDYA